MMSRLTPVSPPTIAPLPTRQNCCTAANPPNDHAIADLAMAAQRHRIGEGDIVTDMAIVPDMGIGHEIAACAHPRDAAALAAAHIHRDHLAQHAIDTDLQPPIGEIIVADLAVTAQRTRRR